MIIKKLLPIIGIAILIYILTTLDGEAIIEMFSSINPWYALIAFCSIIPVVLLVNIQWRLILKRHKIRVSFWYSLKNIFIGYFYGFITPGGFGAYTRAIYLSDKSGESLQKCFANVLLFNTIDYLALLLLGLIGGFVLSSQFPNLFPIILVVFIIILSLLILFIRKETGKLFFQKLFASKLFYSVKERWNGHIDALYAELPSFTDVILPFFVSVVGWIVWFSELYLLSFLFNVNVPYIDFILIIAVANVIASIPITIYGLGTREAALIGLFSIYSVSQENVIALSLFWFVLIWLFPSIIGAGVTLLESKSIKHAAQKKDAK